MPTSLYFIHALSPIHCGTGQAIAGVDLPIAREKPTGIPLIPGSSLKGVLRASPSGYEQDADASAKDLHLAAFGPDTANAADYAGAVQFSDANLLLLPMRSLRATFAWVTAPYLLKRLARDLAESGADWSPPSIEPNDDECLVAGERLTVALAGRNRVVFEDFDFAPRQEKSLEPLAQQLGSALFGANAEEDIKHLSERLCIVSDDVMRVLLRLGMEVTTRNRIDSET